MARMESLWCNVIIENYVTGQRLCSSNRSFIFITVTPRENSLIIVGKKAVQKRYKLKELVGICTDDAFPDRVALKFKSHKHNVILLYDFHDRIRDILSFIHEYVALNNQEHIINKACEIDMGSYSCMKRYTIKYDYDILTNLVLENVNLRCLVGLENIPHLQTVSLSGSELGKTLIEKETFWNWMSLKNVRKSVTTLLMDNVDLKVVPFEMQNMTKLETLSMAHNKLICLPHFFGDLTALSRLFVNNNSISYFPHELRRTKLIDINIEENLFRLPLQSDVLPVHRKRPPVEKNAPEKLTNLALFSILNNKVQFERKDINRPIWKYFNNISRCKECNKLMVAYLKNTFYKFGCLHIVNYQNVANVILWQYARCLYPCKQEPQR